MGEISLEAIVNTLSRLADVADGRPISFYDNDIDLARFLAKQLQTAAGCCSFAQLLLECAEKMLIQEQSAVTADIFNTIEKMKGDRHAGP